MKLKKTTFVVLRPPEKNPVRESVEGYISEEFPGLGINKEIHKNKWYATEETYWHITHLNSGRAIITNARSREQAATTARKICDATMPFDWRQSGEVVLANKESLVPLIRTAAHLI